MGGVLEDRRSRPDWYVVEISRLLSMLITKIKKERYEKGVKRMRGGDVDVDDGGGSCLSSQQIHR
jgi:hypothetical protein